MKEFDYYIYIDYSEDLIGYDIIEKSKIKELLPKILRFRHYRNSRNRKIYLQHIKDTIKRENIKNYFLKLKVCGVKNNLDIFVEVLDFVHKHNNCIVFICVDDYQYRIFKKMINVLDGDKVQVVKESSLKKGSQEYQISLVLDNLLNIERRKNEK